MQLSKLIAPIDSRKRNLTEVEVKSLEFDSRMVKPGSVFIAIVGEKFDGHNFIEAARRNGAVAVVTQREIETALPQIVVGDTRIAMGKLAKIFYGEFDEMIKIGITGTNGKTTTAFFIHSILTAARKNPGLISTIYYSGKTKAKADRTTPESLDIFKLFERFQNDGAQAVVMEVSSHALSLNRVDEIRFSAAVFTNLSQDHLDFYKSIDEYKKSKLRIFSLLDEDGVAIFNVDDPTSEAIKAMRFKHAITYGIKHPGDIKGKTIEDSIAGLKVEVYCKNEKYVVRSELIGSFNIYNILAAFAAGVGVGIDTETIVHGIEELKFVRGRMERVVDNVFVDYAHTPAAIENALKALRQYTRGKIIIVFGCGGDRDRGKRPKMGEAASSLADFTILTSDNPRSESANKIIEDIEKGMSNRNYAVIDDRREAICHALSIRGSDDIVLVAGKGHEESQIIGKEKIDFDDVKVIRECLKNS